MSGDETHMIYSCFVCTLYLVLCEYAIILAFMHPLDELKWWHIVVVVVTVVFCLIGVVLWITVGAVVNNPPNDSKCTTFKLFEVKREEK